MRHFLLLLSACAFAGHLSAAVLTVSNNPAQPAQYINIASAISAAVAGDSIYIQPSSLAYGGAVTLDKQLFLIGAGRFPRKDRSTPSRISSSILLGAGSDGSQILGITCLGNINATAGVNNILIQGCYTERSIGTGGNACANWIIKDCVIRGDQGNVNPYAFFVTNGTNFLVENCVVGGSMREFANGTYRHCLFIQNQSGFGSVFSGACGNNLFENNIFYGVNVQNQLNNTYNHNLIFGNGTADTIPAGNLISNNVIGQNPSFANASLTVVNYGFRTNDFTLLSGSPAIAAGTNGTDIGVLGGPTPYTRSGESHIPQIRSMELDNSIVPHGATIQVHLITTKAEGQ